jgi:hypothetical protein
VITIDFRRKYWTLCVNGAPLMTFASLERAVAFCPEALVRLAARDESIAHPDAAVVR